MGLGLAGITVVFLALPGMILAVLLRLRREEQAPPVLMDAGWKVIAIAFTSAFFIHFLAVLLARCCAKLFGTARPDLEIVGILAGVSQHKLQLRALQNVQQHFVGIFAYLLLTIILAALIGIALRWILPSSRNWLEQELEYLQQRDSNPLVWLTTATDLDGETWLFEGVYERHLNDRGGEPEFVFLRLAKRRRLIDDNQEERWSSIPGEIFILKLDRWHSVNLDAFYFEPNDESGSA